MRKESRTCEPTCRNVLRDWREREEKVLGDQWRKLDIHRKRWKMEHGKKRQGVEAKCIRGNVKYSGCVMLAWPDA